MKNFLIATVLAAGMTVGPVMSAAIAQGMGTMTQPADAFAMNQQQQQMYMNWPDDKRITYQNWDVQAQEYYWSLDAEAQNIWWQMNDSQRAQLLNLTPEQKTMAWSAIRGQMAGTNTDTRTMAPPSPPLANSGPAIRFVSNAVVQDIPPPHNGPYPVCESDEDNNCVQR